MLTVVWQQVLGPSDVAALDALYARVIWIPDGEIAPLTDAAERYREIIGPPEPADPPSRSGDEQPGEGQSTGATATANGSGSPAGGEAAAGSATAGAGRTGDAHTHATRERQPSIGSLADALEHALATTRDGLLVQLDEDLRLGDVVARAATAPRQTRRGRGGGTGAPCGRIPDRGVDRPRSPTSCATPAATRSGSRRRSPPSRARPTNAHPAGASTAAPTPSRPPGDPPRRTPGAWCATCARRSRHPTSR